MNFYSILWIRKLERFLSSKIGFPSTIIDTNDEMINDSYGYLRGIFSEEGFASIGTWTVDGRRAE